MKVLTWGFLLLLYPHLGPCQSPDIAFNSAGLLKVSEMVRNAEEILVAAKIGSDDAAKRYSRYVVAQKDQDTASFGVYGEFPVPWVAALLAHPVITTALGDQGQHHLLENSQDCIGDSADGVCGNSRHKVFVDIGSGMGRLVIGVAGMVANSWSQGSRVVGIEATKELALEGSRLVRYLEESGAVMPGLVESLHDDVLNPRSPATVNALASADIVFCYSTAFPSEDGLRLPDLSAVLIGLLKPGSIVVTTDKFLVGPRIKFEELVQMTGTDGETIHTFLWRMEKSPFTGGISAAHEEIRLRWTGVDACAESPEACDALMAVI